MFCDCIELDVECIDEDKGIYFTVPARLRTVESVCQFIAHHWRIPMEQITVLNYYGCAVAPKTSLKSITKREKPLRVSRRKHELSPISKQEHSTPISVTRDIQNTAASPHLVAVAKNVLQPSKAVNSVIISAPSSKTTTRTNTPNSTIPEVKIEDPVRGYVYLWNDVEKDFSIFQMKELIAALNSTFAVERINLFYQDNTGTCCALPNYVTLGEISQTYVLLRLDVSEAELDHPRLTAAVIEAHSGKILPETFESVVPSPEVFRTKKTRGEHRVPPEVFTQPPERAATTTTTRSISLLREEERKLSAQLAHLKRFPPH
eukprot:PhF_6_TR19053/c0_g1_i1/m.27999